MYLVCGIHGSGKMRYCKFLEKKLGLPYFSASKIIDSIIKPNQEKSLQIDERQKVLITEINKFKERHKKFILDAHLCLINKNRHIERISQEVFLSFHFSTIYFLKASEKEIQKRMKERDGIDWDIEYIKKFQCEEIKYAKELAKLCGSELKVIDRSKNENILLPILPVYVDKILNGEKKYEFRKKLAKKDIKKIYIYETAPTKKIVGEAEVVSKITMEKNDLWQLTCDKAGITQDFYLKYFLNQSHASAYEIGNVIRYSEGVSLEYVGISYAPQSYVYIGDM